MTPGRTGWLLLCKQIWKVIVGRGEVVPRWLVLLYILVIEPGESICELSLSPSWSVSSSLSLPPPHPLCYPSPTVIPHLWPACDVYPRQMGHGKMAAVALATEWRARGGESERLFFFFSFLGWMFRLSRRYREYVKRAAGTHKARASVSVQLRSGHRH